MKTKKGSSEEYMWYSGGRHTGRTFRALLTCGLEASMGKEITYQAENNEQRDRALHQAVKMFDGFAELKGHNLHFPDGGKILFRVRSELYKIKNTIVDDWL